MSDYLSHLVGRQLSPESGVRPRVASMFAPSEHVPEEGAALAEALEERETPGTAPRSAARLEPWNSVARALASPPRPGRAPVPSMAAGLGRERVGSRPEPAAPASVVARGLDVDVPPAPRSAPRGSVVAEDPLSPEAPRGAGLASAVVSGLDAEAPREGRVPGSLPVRPVLPATEAMPVRAPLPEGPRPRSPGGTPHVGERVSSRGTLALPEELAGRQGPSSAKETSTSFSEGHGPARHEAASPVADSAAAPVRGAAPSPERVRAAVGVPVRASSSSEAGAEPSASPRGPAVPVQAERGVSAPLASAPESAPAPVVQVTIGRIEVRAATPPAPARPAPTRTPSPSLSLDEYLRRRNGGGR